METTEEKSQHLDLGLQSDLATNRQDQPIINDEKLEQMLTEEFEKLVISVEDGVLNRHFKEHAVAEEEEGEQEEGELKRAIDEELYHLVMKEVVNEIQVESSSSEGGVEKSQALRRFVDEALERHGVNKDLLEDPMECRVLEDKEVDENGSGVEIHVKQVVDVDDEKVFEHKDDADLKEKHEIVIEGEHGSIEVLENEYGDERRSDNGDDRGSENESANVVGVGEEEEAEGSVAGPNDDKPKKYLYPLRPDAEDCSYYMRTGMCKFGSNCKFNHPIRRRNQAVKFVQAAKETVKHKEENTDKSGQIECKFYLSSGGCKYGKACKYNHSKGRTAVFPVAEYNFLGLPIRPGEKECPYYMRNGSCKYGPNCRFNHPDPTAVGGGDAPATYVDGGSIALQAASPTSMSSWSTPRTPNDSAPYAPLMYSPTHSMPPPIPDWNGYQGPAAPNPVYPTSERSLPTPPAFVINNPPSDANLYPHHQQQLLVPEFPERPGQLECSYFMKTGDCKYRSACKFHHPRSHIPWMVPSVLSDKGLPLRPDQNICTYYRRYGICKYGPACKYDHPVNYKSPASAGGYGQGGSDEPLIQQHV